MIRHLLVVTTLLLTPFAATPAADSPAPAAPSITPHPTEAKLLLLGNWADPSILKDGDDYYLTHSSFEFQPGLLVWHSKDLRSWRPISRAVTNQPGSIWAPDLIKHDGEFYIMGRWSKGRAGDGTACCTGTGTATARWVAAHSLSRSNGPRTAGFKCPHAGPQAGIAPSTSRCR